MSLSNKQKEIRKFPTSPGVYFFRGIKNEILYIGKATSLKDRVRSYYAKDLMTTRGPLLVQMLEKVKSIKFEKTDSVLEALILEANLIKKHQPRYNSKEKDDKSYNYIVITKEDFPRVLLVRGKDLAESFSKEMRLYEIGPFPQGGTLKEAMRIIRRIFPYRDTCTPYSGRSNLDVSFPSTWKRNVQVVQVAKKKAKPCFNAQIGLCPGVCSGEISKREYRKEIKHLICFLEGKKQAVVREFKKEMKEYVKKEAFEKANEVKKRLFVLEHIQDVSLLKKRSDEFPASGPRGSASSPRRYRIESYDIAHLSGKEMVGVMTVIENGFPNKNEYRKFKIRSVSTSNDPAALKEVITRRLGHAEWNLPMIIVVDGNEVQKKVAEGVIKEKGFNIEVVAVVKDNRHKARALIGKKGFVENHKDAILLANAEAHRFAIAFHRLRRKKAFLP